MPSSWVDAVNVLRTIINKLDTVYFTEMWLGQVRYTISLLDLLEVIFGVMVLKTLMDNLWGFTDKVNSRG